MIIDRPEKAKQMLHRVANRIENNPDMYDQEQWVVTDHGMEGKWGVVDDKLDLIDPFDCGTKACIAGWAVLEDWYDKYPVLKAKAMELPEPDRADVVPFLNTDDNFVKDGMTLLGLESGEAGILFAESWLPHDYEDCDDEIAIAKKTAQALRDMSEGVSVFGVTYDREDEGEGPDGSDYS